MDKEKVGFTRAIAQFVVNTKMDQIPDKIYEHAKVAFMDWLGVTLGGKDDPLVKILIRYADMMGGYEQATVLGHGMKKTVSQTTLINGAASHALDYDDTLKVFLGHPTVTLFPSLLALAEWKEKSGIELLTAYIIGLEAGATIGACAGMDHYMSGWHATSTLGYLASAAGCARLLGLDEQQTVYALGIAATQSSGLKRNFGTMCKPFHAGRSSQGGLLAALLASEGFTSAEDILEAPLGFFHVLRGQVNEQVLETLGKSWEVENLAQKYHASCHGTHSAIEAILSIIQETSLKPGQIKSIEVYTSQLSIDAAGKLEPKTGLEGKFSIPYCVANAVLRGNTGTVAFTDEKVNDPEVREFMKKISVELNDKFKILEAEVKVETTDGKVYSKFFDILEMIPELEVKKKKINEKFLDLCFPVLGKEKSEKLAQEIFSLEKVENMKNFVAEIS